MATLTPPGALRGTLTVDDADVERYLTAGWVRSDGGDGGLPEPEETQKVTETGGPEADDEDREFVATIVSDSLGDESVLSTDFGREGDERVKGGTEPLRAAGDVEGQVETGKRPEPAQEAEVRGDADIQPPSPDRADAKAAEVAEKGTDDKPLPRTARAKGK